MTCKKIVRSFIALCITAALAVAVCGCDDLGAYTDVSEYYSSFGDVVLIDANKPKGDSFTKSVKEYFYNEESRENFLEKRPEDLAEGEEAYSGVDALEYVYMAIPLECDMEMDSLALYMRGAKNQSVYLSVYIIDKGDIPSNWRAIGDPETETVEEDGKTVEKPIEYDDPDPSTSIANEVIHLSDSSWSSFLIDTFMVDKNVSSSTIQVTDKQCLLIQFRNNSGVRSALTEGGPLVDKISGLELEPASFTMTNLLVRALTRSGAAEN